MNPRLFMAILLAGAMALGCGPKSIGSECSGADDGKSCDGNLCLALNDNAQQKKGICSKSCEGDEECGSSALCVEVQENVGACLQSCHEGGDCSDGFACVPLDDGTTKVCLVEAGGGGGGGGPADCAGKGCAIDTTEATISGYCSGKPGTKQVCDCPSTDIPPSCTPTDPAAANLYCCP